MARMSGLLGAILLGTAITAAFSAATATGEDYSHVHKTPAGWSDDAQGGRVIVKFKSHATALSVTAGSVQSGPQAASLLGSRLGLALANGRVLGERTQVMTSSTLGSTDLAVNVARDSEVEWVEVDHRRFIQAVPDDPLYPTGQTTTTPVVGQWYLRAPVATGNASTSTVSAINIEPAWAITTNAASATAASTSAIVIADVDTGVTSHPDLAAKFFAETFAASASVPYGYDFVGYANGDSNPVLHANDGDLADPDPSDPGDWVTADEAAGTAANGAFSGCTEEDSSWHGTQTAGILGAATNNGVGMAGVGYDTMIVPVRALGKCGGFDSDIIAAMKWAGGVLVDSSIPTNIHPARVINMSLGGTGACGSAYQEALTQLRDNKVIVVAAAGNDAGLAVIAPANCQPVTAGDTPIVIAVAGLRNVGDKAGYSDIGSQVAIAAPAGNCVNNGDPCLFPIPTTANTGTTTPVAPTYSNGRYTEGEASLGTSFATPMVSGTVALMLAAAPNLTNAQVIGLLKSTATTFPTTGGSSGTQACHTPTTAIQDECYCTTATCGAGMLNAGAAVAAAVAYVSPVPVISGGSTVVAGSSLTLTGSSSSAATIGSYQWKLASGANFATLTANGSTATLTGTGAGTAVVQLTVTDSLGLSVSTTSNVTVSAAPSSSGGGGGGATHPAWLLALALAGVLLAPRKRRAVR